MSRRRAWVDVAGHSSVALYSENFFFRDVVWSHLKDQLGEEGEEEEESAKPAE